VFNPPSPWENERGGLPWEIVDVTAPDGSTVALADITGKFTSTDSTNALGKTVSFSGTLYSDYAIGIKSDGSVVTSGPATERVKRVIVAIGSKSFVANNATEMKGVRDYINSFPNWRLSFELSVQGTTVTNTMSRLPLISAKNEGGMFWVTAEDTGDTKSYLIQESSNVGPTPDGTMPQWNSTGIMIKPGESKAVIGLTTWSQYFVRLYDPPTAPLVYDFGKHPSVPRVVDMSI
jgi:hypothetical protein